MTTTGQIRRVLLVDDEASILMGLRRLLGRRKMEITAVPTALDALKLLRMGEFDAIIADYKMPEHDGVWLMRQVAQGHPNVVRILMSGYEIPDIEYIQQQGIVHHWAQKPIEMQELLGFLGVSVAVGGER